MKDIYVSMKISIKDLKGLISEAVDDKYFSMLDKFLGDDEDDEDYKELSDEELDAVIEKEQKADQARAQREKDYENRQFNYKPLMNRFNKTDYPMGTKFFAYISPDPFYKAVIASIPVFKGKKIIDWNSEVVYLEQRREPQFYMNDEYSDFKKEVLRIKNRLGPNTWGSYAEI